MRLYNYHYTSEYLPKGATFPRNGWFVSRRAFETMIDKWNSETAVWKFTETDEDFVQNSKVEPEEAPDDTFYYESSGQPRKTQKKQSWLAY